MIDLYLLRHAKAVQGGPSLPDHERPLAPRGQRNAQALAQHLAALPDGPPRLDLILCSTSARTRETLAPLLPVWHDPPPVRYEHGLYLAGPSAIRKRLQALGSDVSAVLVVGHNPDLHQLAAWAAGSGDAADLAALRAEYPTGTLSRIVFSAGGWDQVDAGTGRLRLYLPPRNLP